jgi:pimeloyl-ACP methyl ester carboxylesterase
MSHPVRRHVVDVDGRAVHLRVLGSGPAAVLLHLSPRSSVQVLPLAQALADRFTCYCPDTPGYGLSDPLPLDRPEIADYADATAALLDALGLDAPALYGSHTGAEIAMELGLRHPGRVSVIVADGFPVFTVREQEEQLRRYLPRFAPEWSGAHMAALWSRVRDQFMFFPWYAAGAADRLRFDPAPIEVHDGVVADLLAAGVADAPSYATGYGAAFRYDGPGAAARAGAVGAPIIDLCRQDDLLFPHMDRIEAAAPGADLRRLPVGIDGWAEAVAAALTVPGAAPAPALPPQSPRVFFTEGGMLMRRFGPGGAEAATLLLHGHPGSGAMLARAASRIGGTAFVPDLPGSGASAPLGGDGATLAARMAAALDAALPAGPVAVEAWFTGGRVAEALTARAPGRFRITALRDPMPDGAALDALRAHYVQEMPSDWHGSHMMAAWWRARDALAYAPWFARTAATQKPLPTEVDLAMLQAHATAILQGRFTEPEVIRALLR